MIAEAEADGTVIGVNGYDNGVDQFTGTGDTVIQDIYYSRMLDFSETALVDIDVIDAGNGNDTIVASNVSAAEYRAGAGNDLLIAGGDVDTTWVFTGADNGYDTIERSIAEGTDPTNTVVARVETEGTVIGLNGYNNGVGCVRGPCLGRHHPP